MTATRRSEPRAKDSAGRRSKCPSRNSAPAFSGRRDPSCSSACTGRVARLESTKRVRAPSRSSSRSVRWLVAVSALSPEQFEHFLNVRNVPFARLFRFRIVLRVVVAVGQVRDRPDRATRSPVPNCRDPDRSRPRKASSARRSSYGNRRAAAPDHAQFSARRCARGRRESVRCRASQSLFRRCTRHRSRRSSG